MDTYQSNVGNATALYEIIYGVYDMVSFLSPHHK